MSSKSTSANDPTRSSELVKQFDDIVQQVGLDPDRAAGLSIREIMHTAVKLVRDEADLGEIKLISRSLKELRYALKMFRPYKETRKISVFGSARTPEDHPDYIACVEFSRYLAEAGWMVITGAGDGIMKAGHGGAGKERSFGVSIRLPFETNANDIIAQDPKLATFRYFFTRKLTFMWMSHAVALFAGGFGTQDEGFEALTLIQTGKAPMIPVVCVDPPGGTYWKHWDNYVRKSLLENGWISPEDTSLYYVTDDTRDAANHIMSFYRNYHSQRFVRDTMVIRIQRPLTNDQLDQLNTEFGSLVKEGKIEQGGPLRPEQNLYPELPRLTFVSHKRAYGKLRQMIDQINQFDLENTSVRQG